MGCTAPHFAWNDRHGSPFLFASPDGKVPSSARKVHIRRLRDILHLSIQRGDLLLAQRAFALLSRCEEIEWMVIWKIGLILLAVDSPPGDILGTANHIKFLRVMMLQHPEEREPLVQELVLSLAVAGRERDALDELDLYLPSPPYQDNSVLHTYAGLLFDSLRNIGQTNDVSKQILLREAKHHLERARALEPENVVAQVFIHKVRQLSIAC
ncbi:hypothetical protein BJV74DRAFT_971121 [Russula compacta]|nr:hypothetical protein BJV74DRAFT_971121 [Russula compacta]